MGLLGNLFGPKIDKLKQHRDVDGLKAILASDSRPELRIDAMDALVELAGADSSESLVTVLGDTDSVVDQAAEKALRTLGADASGAFASSLSLPVGDRALGLLLDLGDASAKPLQAAAHDEDEAGRHRAISGLLDLAETTKSDEIHEQCFRSILAALGDKEPTCRAEAAAGLAAFGDPRAAKALAAQLKDGDEGVREACRSTLSGIGSPAVPYLVGALMDRNPNSKLLAAGLLAEVDTAPVEVQDRQAMLGKLIDLLGSKNETIGPLVAATINRTPAADVIDIQLQRLEDPNSDEREETEDFVRQLLEHCAIEPQERQAAERRLAQIIAAESEDGGTE